MPEKIKNIQSPKGISRWAFRLPVQLYRWGLGGLLGGRFLLLSHTGRKSGLRRETVLEVVRMDLESSSVVIASGFGDRSDWCLNIQADPYVQVKIGRSEYPAKAQRLDPLEAGKELVLYNRDHPKAMRELAKFMGYSLDGTEADIEALGQILPMFVLHLNQKKGQ